MALLRATLGEILLVACNSSKHSNQTVVKRCLLTSSQNEAPKPSHQTKNKFVTQNCEKTDIQNVAIIGGGSMGSGIGTIASTSNFTVKIMDVLDEYTQSCLVNIRKTLQKLSHDKFPKEPRAAEKFINDTMNNVDATLSLEEAVYDADVVIEAIPEDLEGKKKLFQMLDTLTPERTILVSNTTSLPISALAEVTKRPDRVGGMHFNPALNVNLLEVIRSPHMSKETFDKLIKFSKNLGKQPTVCKDTPGFIVNRLAVPYILDAIRLNSTDVANMKDIDFAMKEGTGYPLGPFELADAMGLDLVLDIARELYDQNLVLHEPPAILIEMVRKGWLGVKSQRGFYDYYNKR